MTQQLPLLGVMRDRTCPGADHLTDEVDPLGRVPFVEALEREWDSFAHFVCYQINPECESPRLNKAIYDEVLDQGFTIETTCIALDYDLPEHREWEPKEVDVFLETLKEAGGEWPMAMDWTAWYSTNRGCRFIYVLERPIASNLAEHRHRLLCGDFIRHGLHVDVHVSDWNRVFQLPKVVRNGERTSERASFRLLIQPEKRLPDLHPVIQGRFELNKLALDMPTPEQAYSLLYTSSRRGKVQTDFYKTAKQRLKGRECFPCIFEAMPMAAPGSRDSTIHSYVGQATSLLQHIEGVGPEHIYALFLPSVQQFEPDAQTPDWPACLWNHVRRLWSKEESRQKKIEEEALAKTVDAEFMTTNILQGMKQWCDSPELNKPAVEALDWIRSRLLVSFGTQYAVMRPDGHYCENLILSNQIVPCIRTLGLDRSGLIQVRKLAKDGRGMIDCPAQEIVNAHATIVSGVRCEPQISGGFIEHIDSQEATLVLPSYRRNPDLEPTFDAEVDEWLQVLFGGNYEIGIKWLSWALAFEEGPICALSIKGAAGIGKKMLVMGLAETLERPALADVNDLVTSYQYGLRQSPFLIVNEGWPQGIGYGKHPADQFRALVSGDEIRCNEKYKAPVSVVMLPRIIFTTNNDNVVHKLTAGRNLSPEDRDALAVRLLHMNLRNSACRWLEERGNTAFTGAKGRKWVASEGESDYVLAKHLLYLHANRGKKPTTRFLVEGNANDEIIFMMQTQSGNAPLVIEALIKMLDTRQTWDGLAIVDGKLYVTAAQVLEFWRMYMGGNSRDHLSIPIIGQVFRGLSVEDRSDARVLRTKESQGRRRWHEIDVQLLRQIAMQDGWRCRVLEDLNEHLEAKAAEIIGRTTMDHSFSGREVKN